MHMLLHRRPASNRRRLFRRNHLHRRRSLSWRPHANDDVTAASHTRAMRQPYADSDNATARFRGLRYAMHQPDGRHPLEVGCCPPSERSWFCTTPPGGVG